MRTPDRTLDPRIARESVDSCRFLHSLVVFLPESTEEAIEACNLLSFNNVSWVPGQTMATLGLIGWSLFGPAGSIGSIRIFPRPARSSRRSAYHRRPFAALRSSSLDLPIPSWPQTCICMSTCSKLDANPRFRMHRSTCRMLTFSVN